MPASSSLLSQTKSRSTEQEQKNGPENRQSALDTGATTIQTIANSGQFFELVERLKRLPGAEFVRVEGGQGGLQFAGRGRFGGGRGVRLWQGREKVGLGLLAGGGGFQPGEHVAGVVHHGGGHAGQAGDLDAVAAAGGAGLDFVQEGDSLFPHRQRTKTPPSLWV